MAKKIEQGSNSGEQEESAQIPQYLQEKIDQLQNLENGQYPNWSKPEDIQELKEKLRAEIEDIQNNLRDHEMASQERKNNIVEKFGPETLRDTEKITGNIRQNIEQHLLTVQDREEAQRILKLWEEFSNIISNQVAPSGDMRPRKVEKALEEAIFTITRGKIKK